MKSTALRQYIKDKTLTSPDVLEDCNLVIDGASYFRNTYKKSGCQFILGPECDRYADFIINKLSSFLDSNIKCYVIFNGAKKNDLDETIEIHEKIIDKRSFNKQKLDDVEYFQPLLAEDVVKQVLEEMKIKYFVCEYESIEAIVGVARKFKCPVLTNNIEYSLYGVSCIPLNSLEYENINNEFKCKIYEHDAVKTAFGVYGKMPILLTLLNEKCELVLEELTGEDFWEKSDAILPAIRWVKRHREANVVDTILKNINDKEQKKTFMEVYEKIETLYLYPSCHLAVKYFLRKNQYGLFKDDKKWFAKGVSNGRIAPPYINLKKKGVICGSLIVNDINRPDALLAAMDIIAYSHCLLTNSQYSTITFVKRKCDSSMVREIVTYRANEISNRDIFSKRDVKYKKYECDSDPFQTFLKEILAGCDYNTPLITLFIADYWILVLALVYYIHKKNNDFIFSAYCILLSYVMLGPVSKKMDVIKNKLIVSESEKDCKDFYNGLKFLFNRSDIRQFDSGIVHNFSEFQHCLQHMNYLNKLCGEKIPCTVYHDTYNATFICNTFLLMKDKHNLMTFLETKFTESKYLTFYKKIVTDFENCLSAVKVFSKKT